MDKEFFATAARERVRKVQETSRFMGIREKVLGQV